MPVRDRSRYVLLLVVSLAVLAVVAPASAQARSRTSIAATHRTIRSGSVVGVHGTVSPRQVGHVVYLQQRIGHRWHRIRRQRLNRASRYWFTVRPSRPGVKTFRVVDPATRRVAGSASRAVAVRVRPRARSCTPGYSPCIPPGPDVDCAGGSGNGPRYVQGPVYVTGSDPYGLDAIACTS